MDPLSRLREESKNRFIAGNGSPAATSSSSGFENPDDLSYLEGFAKNAAWSLGPGMVGVTPPNDLLKWQVQNQGSDLISGMLGAAVPYLGWMKFVDGTSKAAQGIRGVMDRAAPISNMGTNPVLTGATREVIRFAPFEAGRVAAAPLLGPMFENSVGGDYRGAWDVAQSASLDLAVGGAVGGIFGGLSAYGRKLKKKRGLRPGADLNAPLQIQLRQMRQAAMEGKVGPENTEIFEAAKNRVKREIVEEGAANNKYFQDKKRNEELGVMFTPKSKTRFRVGKLTSKSLFQSDRIARTLEGLPEDWEAYAKFPRIVQSRRTGNAAKNAKNDEATLQLMNKLKNGGGSTRWDYIQDENTFVVSKKLNDTDWMVFKTDNPDMFLPEESRWKDAMTTNSKLTFGSELGTLPTNTGSELWDYGMKLQEQVPFVDWRGLKNSDGTRRELAKEILAKSGFKPYEGTEEALRRAGLFVRRYMAPAQLQTTDNPVANRIRIVAKEMLEYGEQKAQRGILGTPKRETGSQVKSAFLGPKWENNGSIAAMAREISKSPEEWDGIIKTIQSAKGWRNGIKQYGLTERGVQLLKAIEREDSILSESIIAAQKAAGVEGKDLFRPMANHFMLSRTWKGSWRVPVYNGKNNLVYIAGGETKAEADKIADAMVEAKDGWHRTVAMNSSEMQDIELLKRLHSNDVDFKTAMRMQSEMRKAPKKARDPGTFKARQNVSGYQTEYSTDDFIRSMISHARRYRRFEAETSIHAMFKKDLEKLQWDDPEAYQTLLMRMDKMFGKEGEISKAINSAFDVPLSGVLGKNSASRIVGAMNKTLYRYALGFANTGYAIATLATFIQTAFPMMQLVNTLAHRAPERLAKYTTYQPVFSERGARMLGTIDTMKIAGQGWKELGNPDGGLLKNLHRAAEEGVTDPRFIDEWVGQTAVNKQRFKGILNGEEGFSKVIAAIADTVPAIMERGARGHTFAMGHVFYRDVMGVTDPEILYRLAKDFTEKTQYMYSAGDRAQIFNGPIGGMFGLFKNWMSHYLGWMLSYTGEAVRHNNWKPLLWMMAGTSAVGGVGALPFIGTADDLNKVFNDESLLTTMYEMQGGADPDGINFADLLYYGLPSLAGVSIQGTVSAPLADPGADIIRMMSFAHLQQAQKMYNALGPIADGWDDRGRYLLSDPEVRRAVLNGFAPKTLVRMAQSWESDVLRSMNTGNAMVTGMSLIERTLWAGSINPTRVEKQFEISRDLWRDQEKRKERVGYYGQQMANMHEAGDSEGIKRLLFRAMVEGIPADSIQRSAQARLRRQNTGLIESQFDAAVQMKMRDLGIL